MRDSGHQRQSAAPTLDDALQYLLIPEMDAVEVPDRHRIALPAVPNRSAHAPAECRIASAIRVPPRCSARHTRAAHFPEAAHSLARGQDRDKCV